MPSRDDETIEHAATPSGRADSRNSAEQRAELVPAQHPPAGVGQASGTATAHRSASGSFATAMSAFIDRASSSAASIAPGSSGFGKATVGKSGSGSACDGHHRRYGEPRASDRALDQSRPTPCRGV